MGDEIFLAPEITMQEEPGEIIINGGAVSVEIDDDLSGELELVSSIHGAAPVLFEAGDAELIVMIGRGGSNFLV